MKNWSPKTFSLFQLYFFGWFGSTALVLAAGLAGFGCDFLQPLNTTRPTSNITNTIMVQTLPFIFVSP
jgi:hypothetical protein